jgi:hypothetical protein
MQKLGPDLMKVYYWTILTTDVDQIGEEAWPCDTAQAKAIHIDADAKNHRSQHL